MRIIIFLIKKYFKKHDKGDYVNILNKYNDYFENLSANNKEKFIDRLIAFLNTAEFKDTRHLKVNTKMKVIIASAFIQITFGLKKYRLQKFYRIFVAPQSYNYRSMGKQLFAGDVNTETNIISLAWPAVERGYEIPDDAVNIALHEFGHCLAIENFSRYYFENFFSERDWDLYKEKAVKKLQIIQNKENIVIRAYGGTNLMELFAVSIENFFERPQYFKDNIPDYYNSLSNLLNQDPINKSNPVKNNFMESF